MAKPIPILLFHEFTDDLKTHLEWLQKEGYESRHLSDVRDYLTDPEHTNYPEKVVVITFDDALLDFFEKSAPLLRQYEFSATVCVPTGYVSDSTEFRKVSSWRAGHCQPIMTWDELRALKKDGFEIIPHSVNHIALTELVDDYPELLQCEIRCSKHMLRKELSLDKIEFFSFPYGAGWGNPRIEQVLSNEGYVGALKSENQSADPWTSMSRIPRWQLSSKITPSMMKSEIDEA